ncbi:MAG: glycoside hydrolase family 16 protein [Prevotellaceae bacterium]|jgi:beta-glucanase (GH16 family)|nr:glycoside hydrolase family 16 protein [Prevotellaceae bacterium]
MMKIYVYFFLFVALCAGCAGGGNGDGKKENTGNGFVPEGYTLVWSDEFDDTPNGLPSNEWWFETGNSGWGNNEPQYYVDRVLGTDTVAKIKDGKLTITACKLAEPYAGSQPNPGAEIISARMNTGKAWTYGYFEMKALLPGGRGTWAAFWMLPKNFQSWPLDGEIDIMEYVGYRPDVTQASVHTDAYNHVAGTEKTATRSAPGAERKFYTYALLWTEDVIKGYFEGREYFSFANDRAGDKRTWPFNEPFYLKLNLAIGGNWGGSQGIDDAIFPSKYEIDYVRVYQKN